MPKVFPGEGKFKFRLNQCGTEDKLIQNPNLAVNLRLNEGPCILHRTNLAVTLRLNEGPCILQRTNLAVNLRLN